MLQNEPFRCIFKDRYFGHILFSVLKGVKCDMPFNMLKSFFKNPKRSGGGDVQKVERGPDKSQVIVSFKDWKGQT